MNKGVTPCQSLMPSALPGSHAAIVSVIKAGTKAVVGPAPQVPTAIRVMVTVTFSFKTLLVLGATGVATSALLPPRSPWVVAAVVC